MKIDVVYTWVDGHDPEWIKRKEKRLIDLGITVPSTANHSCRFVQHDELKYSLRSIFAFAPWVNNIYIITDNQIPVWFNRDNTKVQIVDHKFIFEDKTCLPTYSSRAIETKLHKIPGLSEYYIYLNDDFFLGRPCNKNDFIANNGKPYIFLETGNTFLTKKKALENDKKSTHKNEYQAGLANSRILIAQEYGKVNKHTLSHSFRVMRKSILNMLEEKFNDRFIETSQHPFRSFTDILSYAIYCYYMLAVKQGIPKMTPEIRSRKYILQNLINRHKKYLYKYIDIDSKNLNKALNNIKKYKHFMFCLNDGHDTTDEDYETVHKFLEDFFPNKTPAEK